MISLISIIIYLILAILVYIVQTLLLRRSQNKIIHSIPLFVLIAALLAACIMSVIDANGESVKCGTLMPAVRMIKDAVTVCMVADAAAMVINKIKKKD